MDTQAFDACAQELRVKHILVSRGGKLCFRADYDGEIRRNQYSVSKSFTSVAVGIAVREGLLALEERLVDAFEEDVPAQPCENLRLATVRDLLTMALGQEKGFLMGEQRPFLRERDWVKCALALPFTDKPGTKFVYNNVGPYLAGVLLQRRAGCDLVDYLMPRLFEPLGIMRPSWETDPQGNTFGAGGLFLSVSELLRFGELLLLEGRVGKRRLIEADYIRQASARQVDNDRGGYGYLFWRGAGDSYRAAGKYGQFAIVLPHEDTVIAVNAECMEQNRLLAFLMENRKLLIG